MLSQDLLFLLCPISHPTNLSLQAHRCSAKLISSTFSGSLTCPYQRARLHCAFPLVSWTASIKFMLPLKWNEVTCSLLKCQLLSCLLLGDSSTLCTTMPPTAPARGICHSWCAAKAFRNCNPPAKKYTPVGAVKKSKAKQGSSNVNF